VEDYKVHEEDYKGYKIKIYQDTDYDHLSYNEHFGHMIFFHGRYDIGDKHNLSVEGLDRIIKKQGVVSLPVYMYDHSGITIRTYPFSCPWDSGQIGYIYATADDIKKNYNVKKVRPHHRAKALALLESEIKTYDDCLTGNVYGYVVEKEIVTCDCCENKEMEQVESCWGFVGDYTGYCLEEARTTVDYLTKEN
jgi:hypothetical protein